MVITISRALTDVRYKKLHQPGHVMRRLIIILGGGSYIQIKGEDALYASVCGLMGSMEAE